MTQMATEVSAAPIINTRQAGAGLLGLVFGFIPGLFGLSLYFSHNYFLAMLCYSCALLFFKTGLQIKGLLKYVLRIFISSEHIEKRATDLIQSQIWLRATYEKLVIQGKIAESDVGLQSKTLLDDYLTRTLFGDRKSVQYDEVESFTRVNHYLIAHEAYLFVAQALEFVAAVMPLLGLVSTIWEMTQILGGMGEGANLETLAPGIGVAMANTLYGAMMAIIFKILAARFKQQIKTLEYDFETTMTLYKSIKNGVV